MARTYKRGVLERQAGRPARSNAANCVKAGGPKPQKRRILRRKQTVSGREVEASECLPFFVTAADHCRRASRAASAAFFISAVVSASWPPMPAIAPPPRAGWRPNIRPASPEYRSAAAAGSVEIANDQYTAAASGTTTGLIKFFTGAHGTGAAHGILAGSQPMPTSYGATIYYDHKIDDVRMALAGGNVTDYAAEPPLPPAPDRIPVTDADRRGVFDPMTSMLNRVAGSRRSGHSASLQSQGSGVRRPRALRFAQRI